MFKRFVEQPTGVIYVDVMSGTLHTGTLEITPAEYVTLGVVAQVGVAGQRQEPRLRLSARLDAQWVCLVELGGEFRLSDLLAGRHAELLKIVCRVGTILEIKFLWFL